MSEVVTGVDAKFFAKVETTFDTVNTWNAGDAVPLLDFKPEPSLEYHRSKEHLGTASLGTEIKGLSGGKWTASFHAKPNAAGTPPDCGEILRAALGNELTVGGVSITYTLGAFVLSLQIARSIGAGLYEVINGAIVEQLEVEVIGNQESKITVSGSFCSFGWCYRGHTDGATYAAGVTTINLAAASIGRVGVNARIQFGGDSGTAGAGYLVTSVDTSTGAIVFTPALVTGFGPGVVVSGIVPAQTLSGTILGGISCGLSVDAVAIGMISGKTTLKTGHHLLSKEATVSKPNRAARGTREVSGELMAYFVDDTATLGTQSAQAPTTLIGRAWDGTLKALIQRAGADTAGLRMKVNTPSSRLAVTSPEVPEAEEATVSIKWVARRSAADEDELTISFD